MNNLKNFISNNVNLVNGKITYYDFDIDFNLLFEDQKWSFKEDLIQVSFNNGGYTLDVGYYPEFDPNGKFLVIAIKNYDWDNPIWKKECKNLYDLKKCIKEAINAITLDKNIS